VSDTTGTWIDGDELTTTELWVRHMRHQVRIGDVLSMLFADPERMLMSDPLLAQSTIDRLVATTYELVIEGESYRRRQRPGHPRPNTPTGVS
jgi:acyl transferase domain-containing protein